LNIISLIVYYCFIQRNIFQPRSSICKSPVLNPDLLSFISTCDQIDFYDSAKTGGIGPDEKSFISFSINGYEAQIDNVNMVIAISIPTGMDATSPVTRFSIRGDYMAANTPVSGLMLARITDPAYFNLLNVPGPQTVSRKASTKFLFSPFSFSWN
jgi:hypothetical protein